MARRTNRFGNGPAPFKGYDARYYNMIPRNPDTGAILQPNSNAILDPRWSTAGVYRIHQKRPAIANADRKACLQTSATEQLGCLVKADPCSIGYAGLEARDAVATDLNGTNDALLLRAPYDPDTSETAAGDIEVYPEPTKVRYLLEPSSPVSGTCAAATVPANRLFAERYPLSRVLWLNASKGFQPNPVTPFADFTNITPGGERTLANCYKNIDGSINTLVKKHGFITLGKECHTGVAGDCPAGSACSVDVPANVGDPTLGTCTVTVDSRMRQCAP
jgi:hypothetical protein